MNSAYQGTFALSLISGRENCNYTLEDVADLSGLSRHTVVVYSRAGLLPPASDPEANGWRFSPDALAKLHHIETVRATSGATLNGVKWILELMKEIDNLRTQVRQSH